VLCPTHKVETRLIRHDRGKMIETCHLCERQKLEGTIRPRAKPSSPGHRRSCDPKRK
jgi:hypothetical protein